MDFDAATIDRLNDNPLYRALGIRLESVATGDARAVLAPTAAACWPSPAQPHGGVLFTVIDTTAAWAASSLAGPDEGCVTVDCSVQYVAPAREAPFTCTATTAARAGRSVFVRAEVRDARGAPVALGQGTFRMVAGAPGAA
jgi:uncharacterized protein (TIGR00369 family)